MYCANVENINLELEIHLIINLSKKFSIVLLKYIFQNNKISHVIHCCSISWQNSFTDSLNYTNDNILGTRNLLEINGLFNGIY